MFGAQAMVYIGLPFHLTAAGRSVAEIGLMVSPWPAAIALARAEGLEGHARSVAARLDLVP
jgi:hypothetical protein